VGEGEAVTRGCQHPRLGACASVAHCNFFQSIFNSAGDSARAWRVTPAANSPYISSRPSRGICRFLRIQFRPTTQINIEVGWVRRGCSRRNPPAVPPGTPQTNQWCAAHARRVTPAANPPYILLPQRAVLRTTHASFVIPSPCKGEGEDGGVQNTLPTSLLHTKFLNFSHWGNHTCRTPRFTISQNSRQGAV